MADDRPEKQIPRKIWQVIFMYPTIAIAIIGAAPKYLQWGENFIKDLPEDLIFAVEFRHRSWYAPQTGELLAQHNICWAATEFAGVPKEVELTSDILFIRFVGKHGRFRLHDREQIEVQPQLEWWWRWIQSQIDQVEAVYCFFNDDFSGHAPAAANKLKSIIGLPVVKPDIPKQMKLF